MPEYDDGSFDRPMHQLEELAAAGRAFARGLPAEEVRARGARRRRVRLVGTVAAASLAVALFTGGALVASGQLSTTAPAELPAATQPPSIAHTTRSPSAAEAPTAPAREPAVRGARRSGVTPVPKVKNRTTPGHTRTQQPPTPTGEPQARPDPMRRPSKPEPPAVAAPTLPRSVLLRANQTWYHHRGDFRVTRTAHGEGGGFVSICQRARLTSTGAIDVWRRDFAFRTGGGAVIRSAALQFRDAQAAATAYDTLAEWANQCRKAVRSRGYERFSDRGRWYNVSSSQGQAQFRSGMTYGPVAGDQYGERAYFDDQALVLNGRRVMVVTLVVPGQDYNWTYSEEDPEHTGLAIHPMFRMLPQAAANTEH
jgi:hypothetical protein